MTKRNLWNGWNKQGTILSLFIVYFVLSLVFWFTEKTAFLHHLRYAFLKTADKIKTGTELDYMEYLKGDNQSTIFVCTIILMIILAVIVVHRESFWDNWDVTLRRIPGFRGKYLLSKSVIVLTPAIGYSVYYATQWLWCYKMYKEEVQWMCNWLLENARATEPYHLLKMKEFFSVLLRKSFFEMLLYSVLIAMALLLLSFTLRKIKKDVLGFIVAIISLLAAVILFTEGIVLVGPAEALILLAGVVLVVGFNVRHVYLKW